MIRGAPGGGVVAAGRPPVRTLAVLVAVLAGLLPAPPAAAQLPPDLLSGQRVRVTPWEGGRQEGRIAFISPIRLSVRTPLGDEVEWEVSELERVELHAGLERRMVRTMLISTLAGGAAAGVTITFLADADGSRSEAFLQGFGVGSAVGAAFGAFIGLVLPHDRWERVYPMVGAGTGPAGAPGGAGGMGVGFSVPWTGPVR
ncbi:MAG: hypothetical protein RH859_09645 [Longimicrobiales bacterium]